MLQNMSFLEKFILGFFFSLHHIAFNLKLVRVLERC